MKITEQLTKASPEILEFSNHCTRIGVLLKQQPDLYRYCYGCIAEAMEISRHTKIQNVDSSEDLARFILEFMFDITIIPKKSDEVAHCNDGV